MLNNCLWIGSVEYLEEYIHMWAAISVFWCRFCSILCWFLEWLVVRHRTVV